MLADWSLHSERARAECNQLVTKTPSRPSSHTPPHPSAGVRWSGLDSFSQATNATYRVSARPTASAEGLVDSGVRRGPTRSPHGVNRRVAAVGGETLHAGESETACRRGPVRCDAMRWATCQYLEVLRALRCRALVVHERLHGGQIRVVRVVRHGVPHQARQLLALVVRLRLRLGLGLRARRRRRAERDAVWKGRRVIHRVHAAGRAAASAVSSLQLQQNCVRRRHTYSTAGLQPHALDSNAER